MRLCKQQHALGCSGFFRVNYFESLQMESFVYCLYICCEKKSESAPMQGTETHPVHGGRRNSWLITLTRSWKTRQTQIVCQSYGQFTFLHGLSSPLPQSLSSIRSSVCAPGLFQVKHGFESLADLQHYKMVDNWCELDYSKVLPANRQTRYSPCIQQQPVWFLSCKLCACSILYL